MPLDLGDPFRTIELAPERVSSGRAVRTNWHVIGGAPSCGKTTLIGLLAARGFRTVSEPARAYLEGELARGRTIAEIRRDGAGLQRKMLELQCEAEAALRPDDLLFLDGAAPSSLAWFRAFGLDPNGILRQCLRHRYASVFLLDPLPLDVDDIRFDDVELVEFLDGWMERDFGVLGYEVVRVPVLSPARRLAFVLQRLATAAPSVSIVR